MPDLKESDMWGHVADRPDGVPHPVSSGHYRGTFTPPRADRHTIQYPGYNGGSDWGGVSLDPVTAVLSSITTTLRTI